MADAESPLPRSPRVKVLIFDRMQAVSRDLRLALPLLGPIEVVASVPSEGEACSLAQALRPDVILLSLDRNDQEGFRTARRITALQLGCGLIGLMANAGPEERRNAHLAGVDAVFLMGEPLDALVEAICHAHPVAQDPRGETP